MSGYRAIAAAIADELEKHPDHWTQGAFAKDAADFDVYRDSDSPPACWCLVGLIHKTCGDRLDLASEVETKFEHLIDAHTIEGWNDDPERTVADVIALCRKVAQS